VPVASVKENNKGTKTLLFTDASLLNWI
jgi:hypothetical protein